MIVLQPQTLRPEMRAGIDDSGAVLLGKLVDTDNHIDNEIHIDARRMTVAERLIEMHLLRRRVGTDGRQLNCAQQIIGLRIIFYYYYLQTANIIILKLLYKNDSFIQ
jgi:hypothetical protein